MGRFTHQSLLGIIQQNDFGLACQSTSVCTCRSFKYLRAGIVTVVALSLPVANAQRFGTTSHARRLAQAAAPAPGLSSEGLPQSCPTEQYIHSGPTNQSIFDQLTIEEYNSVVDYMVSASTSSRHGLNLALHHAFHLQHCIIFLAIL